MCSQSCEPQQIFNSTMTEALSYRNESIDLLCKSTDRFLFDRDPRHERVKEGY